MSIEIQHFDVYPKIVPADATSIVTVRDRYRQFFIQEDAEYEVRYFPLERLSHIGDYKYQEVKLLKPENGILKIEQYFSSEQEHVIEIQEKGNENPAKRRSFRIYSLKEDLFSRKPYKGDLHIHSNYSSGAKESPAYVAAACRRTGYDFMAVTDHRKFFPSREARAAFENTDAELLICNGEEVHPPNNDVHMINFGGGFSVNERMNENIERYMAEVMEIEAGLSEIEDPDSRYQCASCIWCFDRIREAGGLGIFCHPYWQIRTGYHVSSAVISYLFETQPFDAYEVISGYTKHEEESNTLQIARYHDERSKGRNIPIVGVSDAHGCETGALFGWYYTMVFSQSLDQQSLIKSIKDLYSVAVSVIPGETPRAYGPFRYVKYALFLMREVMPDHDRLCREEGLLMLDYLEGKDGADEKLKSLKGGVGRLYMKLWGHGAKEPEE